MVNSRSRLVVFTTLFALFCAACGRARYREEGGGVYDEQLGLLWFGKQVDFLTVAELEQECASRGARIPLISERKFPSAPSTVEGDLHCFGRDWECQPLGDDQPYIDELIHDKAAFDDGRTFFARLTEVAGIGDAVIEPGLVQVRAWDDFDPKYSSAEIRLLCADLGAERPASCFTATLALCVRDARFDVPFGAF